MNGLLADLRHALRLYWRTPGSSVIAVIVLAVGMAFVGAFLSLYVDLVLKPYPGIEGSGEIVTIGQVDGSRFYGMPATLIERMTEEMSSLDVVVGSIVTTLRPPSDGEFLLVEAVSMGFFEGIRPRLAMGRGFEPADHAPDAEPVIVISDRYWRDELEAAPDVLGRIIEGQQPQAEADPDNTSQQEVLSFRIIGVMAPDFSGMGQPEVGGWITFERGLRQMVPAEMLPRIRSMLTFFAIGRMAEGATARSVAREIGARYPVSTEEYQLRSGARIDVVNGIVRNINVYRDAERQLQLFLAGSVLLALVAAANVSLFLLARAPGRRRELAIRMSVGAPLKRLARQLASEAGLLVVVSTALGLFVSIWLTNFLRGLAFLRQAEWNNVTLLDWRVVGLVGAFLLLLMLLVSLAPIFGLKRLGIGGSSRQVAARATIAQRLAGTAQITIATTIGGAAVAFAWYLGSLTLGDPGYKIADRHRIQFNIVFDLNGLVSIAMAQVGAARVREVIETVPGINAVTMSSMAPGSQPFMSTRTVTNPSDPDARLMIGSVNIDDRFVDVLGLRLLYGRAPEESEDGVALVNQAMAQLYFGRDNVAGESLDIPSAAGPTTEIVGVLEDLSFLHPAADVEPILFTKVPPSPFNMSGIVASRLPAAELQQQLQALIDSGELELGTPSVRPLDDLREVQIAPDKVRSWLTIATAGLVVVLAAFGFYGTLRYLVTAGRREYAIRASFGAGPRALGRLVFARGLMLSLPGLTLGALLAFILVAWLRDDFVSPDISPAAVTALVVVGLVVLLGLASLGPARQARRTQPAPLLRED